MGLYEEFEAELTLCRGTVCTIAGLAAAGLASPPPRARRHAAWRARTAAAAAGVLIIASAGGAAGALEGTGHAVAAARGPAARPVLADYDPGRPAASAGPGSPPRAQPQLQPPAPLHPRHGHRPYGLPSDRKHGPGWARHDRGRHRGRRRHGQHGE